eukprot:TRINITY_DN85378_c0_g1_i1.p1 TRINITY_DN85378_c0_g1~~TRINITY_DN85378_c0_g1_i1.p1  ORF type:complete len:387 (+),score=100.73 TRINITY_DN85378_c0_g1_i1:106-1266(+)
MLAASSGAAPRSGEDQRWREAVAEASSIEIEAMHFDQEGRSETAAKSYRKAAAKLLEVAEQLGEDQHGRLQQRAREMDARAAQLEGLFACPGGTGGAASFGDTGGLLYPVSPDDEQQETHLETQGILASSLAETFEPAPPARLNEERKLMGTAAVVGAAAGLLVAGPVTAAAMAAAAGYATTRDDQAGKAARRISAESLGAADRALDKGLKGMDKALDEGRRMLLEGLDEPASSQRPTSDFRAFVQSQRGNRVRAAKACQAIQEQLPGKRLREEATRMRERYPERVPVLCEKAPYSGLPDIPRHKMAVPGTMNCSDFKYIVQKQVREARSRDMAMDQTIYIFVNGLVPRNTQLLADLYEQHRAEDGFLYVRYTAENTLGGLGCLHR